MSSPALSAEGIAMQQQVQRHLGRCLMRIQQYEHLAKALAAHADLAGPAKQLEDIQAKRVEKASTATLGTLVKGETTTFTNLRTLFTANAHKPDALDESKLPSDQPSFATRFRIQMTEEKRAKTVAELDTFVALRNRLVHHFMDDFDILSDAGCTTALQHLHQCYAEIDRHFEAMRAYVQQFHETRQRMAVLIQTPEYSNLLNSGQIPAKIRF